MKDFLKLAGTLCIITFIAAAMLCGVNAMTKDKIAANAVKKRDDALSAILTSAESFNEISESIFAGMTGEETVGYCVTVDAPGGYGGDISMMVGFYRDGSISGIEILSHGETAGLGANCTSDRFKGQFTGKTAPVAVIKGAAASSNQFSAITGATITSRAIEKGINNAYEALNNAGLLEGGVE